MKRSQAKNKDGVEYIVRVDLVSNTKYIVDYKDCMQESLNISEDEFDDLQALFEVTRLTTRAGHH